MRKPYKGEKTGLKTDLNKLKILIFVVLLSNEAMPQIPINGFCKFNSFNTEQGYNSVFTLNFNEDSYTDLILFNPELKQISPYKGEQNGTFSNLPTENIPYELNNLQNILSKDKRISSFAFTSRKNRKAGICTFNINGQFKILKDFTFRYYPDNISTADINGDAKQEILISGSNFDGLSILSQNKNSLEENKIISGRSYNEAILVDLNNDGFPDIAAYNLAENSLEFFYNNSRGYFRKARTIPLTIKIHSLKSFDLNLDGYEDLIFAEGNSIIIMYGDFASTFENHLEIKTKYEPDKFITGDFNSDGKIDISYLSLEESIIACFFAKTGTTFFPEVEYLKSTGIKNFVPYYSKFVNGITAVNKNGKILTITNFNSTLEFVNIAVAARPVAISFFDNGNNGIIDICFIDEISQKLKLLVRNNAGVPDKLFIYPLFQNHKNILVDNLKPHEKVFYCYTPGEKLIEIIKVNFAENLTQRNSLYAPGPVEEIKIRRDEISGLVNLYASYIKNGKLGLSIFRYDNFRYSQTNLDAIADNVLNANISIKKNPEILYWQRILGSLSLFDKSIELRRQPNLVRINFPVDYSYKIISLSGDLFNNDKNILISFLNSAEKSMVVVSSEKSTNILSNGSDTKKIKIDNLNQLFLGEARVNGLKKLFAYAPNNNEIYRLDFLNKGRSFVISKIADVDDVGSYFIKNMTFKFTHLVYTNLTENCITIKELY